jgi:hypothetical protein
VSNTMAYAIFLGEDGKPSHEEAAVERGIMCDD